MMFLDIGMSTNAEFGLGIDIFPDIVGYILIYLAMQKLSDYAKGFKYTKHLMFPLFAIGFATLGTQISTLFISSPSALEKIASLSRVLDITKAPFHFAFYVCVFLGIYSLAKSESVDLPKAVFRARLGIILVSCYYPMYFCAKFLITDPSILLYLNYIVVLLLYFIILFTILLFHYCYSHICYEGEEELAEKEHSFSKFMYFLSGKGRDSDEDSADSTDED